MTLRTRILTIVAVFYLAGGALSGVSALEPPEAPVPLFPGATIRSGEFSLYEHLTLKLEPMQDGQSELNVAGNLWELWVNCPEDNPTLKAYYLGLATEHGAVLADAGANDLHFRYDLPAGPLYVKFHAQGGKYALDILQPAPLHSRVVFLEGQVAGRDANGKSDSPEPPWITDYPHSKCTSFTYNDFNTLELEYRVDGKTVKRTTEGRYWDKRVRIQDTADRLRDWITPADINETLRAAVLAAGGEVLSGEDRRLVFHLENEDVGDLWASVWPQDGKYSIKIVQEQAMEQLLVFDADAMMARLDALGVLTLEGIFFDTAKATLKPASAPALEAALKLMNDYPDLVLEVGGHTDNVGQADDNEKLSQDRASSVREWLTGAGVDSARLAARGYGEGSPVAANETETGRAANRRVELKKISGGQMRGVMSLIQPYPGSKATGQDEKSAQYELEIYEESADGKVAKRTIIGTGFRQYFLALDEAGNRDENLSGVQIRRNYLQAVEDFGGTILAEVSHGLYFRLDNLDGSSTYVSVWAPGAKYQVTAVTPPGSDGSAF